MDDGNDSKDNKSTFESISQAVGDNVKGVIQATKNYSILLNDRTSAVNIIDNATKKWFVRIDNAHKNVNFKHINVNPKLTGIVDPHTAISGTAFHTAENAAWFGKQVGPYLAPAAIAIDAARIGTNVFEDYKKGTVRNTMTVASSISGGWGGGLAGAEAGAAIGSMILPGVGTIAGAIIGGIGGGLGGAKAAEKITDVVADKTEIGIKWFQCHLCQEKFECRIYTDQHREFCPNCTRKLQTGIDLLHCQLCQKNFECGIYTDQRREMCPDCIRKILMGIVLLQCQLGQEEFECMIYTDQHREFCPECIRKIEAGEYVFEFDHSSSDEDDEWFDLPQ